MVEFVIGIRQRGRCTWEHRAEAYRVEVRHTVIVRKVVKGECFYKQNTTASDNNMKKVPSGFTCFGLRCSDPYLSSVGGSLVLGMGFEFGNQAFGQGLELRQPYVQKPSP